MRFACPTIILASRAFAPQMAGEGKTNPALKSHDG
jgi:hypothetical protein